jgi:glutamine amidotransferase
MLITIFDYGAGNLHSLAKATVLAGIELRIETDPLRALETDALVLPGVGGFAAAAERLAPGRSAMRNALENGLPCLAICLGMQILFDQSEEGDGAGIGLLPGSVSRLRARRVPHIGWNTIDHASDPLLTSSSLGIAYYANGYACRPTDSDAVTAWTTHEDDRFPAVVRRARTVGAQFHPEKSSAAGLAFIHAWIREISE